KSCTLRTSCRSQPPVGLPSLSLPSKVYQNTWPKAVASGPNVGWASAGNSPEGNELSCSRMRERDQQNSMSSSNMICILENPNIEELRIDFTPGTPKREVVRGYVIWSSISCGERPGHSVKTIC